jgi:hypothetical protein
MPTKDIVSQAIVVTQNDGSGESSLRKIQNEPDESDPPRFVESEVTTKPILINKKFVSQFSVHSSIHKDPNQQSELQGESSTAKQPIEAMTHGFAKAKENMESQHFAKQTRFSLGQAEKSYNKIEDQTETNSPDFRLTNQDSINIIRPTANFDSPLRRDNSQLSFFAQT